MKIIKRICITFIAAMFLVPIVSNAASLENVSTIDNKNISQYKAEYYTTSPMFINYTTGNYDAPYKFYLEEMLRDEGFETQLKAWQVLNFDLSDTVGGVLENDLLSQKGYFEAILFEVFYEAQRKDSLIDELDSEVKASNVTLHQEFYDVYTSAFENYAYPDIDEELSDEELVRLRQAVFEQNNKLYIDIFGGVDVFNKVLDGATTIDEMVDTISTLTTFKKTGELRIDVLQKMYDECEDYHLKCAIKEMILFYETNYSIAYILANEIYDESLDLLLDKVEEKVWSDLVVSNGGGFAKLTAEVGKAAANAWLSTDKYCESFFEMNSLRIVERLLKDITVEARDEYVADPTEENATFLLSCIDVNVRAYSLGFEYAEKYLTILDDMGINHVAIALGYPGINNSELIAKYKTMRNTKERNYVIAEAMIDEIFAQNKKGYEEAYGKYFKLNGQEDFDTLCRIADELNAIEPSYHTELKIECPESLIISRNVCVGSLKTNSLTINSSSMEIRGDANVGRLYLDDAQLNVKGDFDLCSVSKMVNENDLTRVEGDFTVGHSESTFRSEMTAGTVELCGDLIFREVTLGQFTNDYGYNATGSCKTVFCGEKLQTIKGEIITYRKLGTVDIKNPLFTIDTNRNNVVQIKLASNTKIDYDGEFSCGELDLNGKDFECKGSVSVNNTITAEGEDLSISIEKDLTCAKLNLKSGSMKVSGAAVISRLYLDDAQLNVKGDFDLCSVSKMVNENDLIRVEGDFTVGHSESTFRSEMTAGTVELCGDLIFREVTLGQFTDGYGYYPKGTCKTVFCGTSTQNVTIDSSKPNRDLNLGNVINAHLLEGKVDNSTVINGLYIHDTNYKTGDRYMELSTISDNKGKQYEFTGNDVSPDLTVKYGTQLLKENVDYKIEYTNNKQLGNVTAVVSGVGVYKNSKKLNMKLYLPIFQMFPLSLRWISYIPENR